MLQARPSDTDVRLTRSDGIDQHISKTSKQSWVIPMGVQLIPGGVLLIGTFFLKESPLFYLKHDKEAQAVNSLTYLRKLPADHPYIIEEIGLYRDRIAHERSVVRGKPGLLGYLRGAARECVLPGIRNRVALAFIMFALQNFSGANAINYYVGRRDG